MKQVNSLSAIALAVFLGAGSFSFSQEKNLQRKDEAKTTAMQQKHQEAYFCPMHPEVASNNPGRCPECGMNLEKKKTKNEHEETYACPMHTDVVSNRPGKCPQCGMNMEITRSTGSKEKTGMGMNMEIDPMCAKMCDMMMNGPSKMKMMQDCMMMGMNDMKDMKDMEVMKEAKGSTEMEGKSMGKMKSCCGMMKNK